MVGAADLGNLSAEVGAAAAAAAAVAGKVVRRTEMSIQSLGAEGPAVQRTRSVEVGDQLRSQYLAVRKADP